MRVDLSGANLRGADLGGANLSYVILSGADLCGASLYEANLRGARGISAQELEEQCKILIGATMPNGQWYEEWLESQGRREAREHGGTS